MNNVEIIVVEDNPGHARLIEKNLQRSSLEANVAVCPDGTALFDRLEHPAASHPDAPRRLVLLDLNLPGLGGIEVLRRLKSSPKLHQIPVIVLTTTDDPAEIALCYELGCSMYITKAVDYEEFADSLRRLAQLLAVITLPVAG